jgi:lysophospholipase L1-like esterase
MTENKAWHRIAVLGDSIAVHPGDPVDGYPTQTWADHLAQALTPDAFLNLGVSGTRAAEISSGQLGAALAFRPDLAILAAGANDAARRSFRPDLVEAELAGMIEPLTRAGALVVTLGCFDLSATLGAETARRLRALGRLTERLSHRHGGLHIDFADHPDQHDGVLGADGLHINARGHAIVAATLLEALSPRRPALGACPVAVARGRNTDLPSLGERRSAQPW